jgi:hypothetical protein
VKPPNAPVPAASEGDAEFLELVDGSRVRFRPGDVPALGEWDYRHFLGTDGTGTGGHLAGAGINGATRFPRWVQTLDDLQRVQDAALANVSHVRRGDYDRYLMRSGVNPENTAMVVQVVLEEDGTPVSMFPVNGEFVVKNVQGEIIAQPLDYDALLGW